MLLRAISGLDASRMGGPYTPPVAADLAYWGFPGKDADATVYNHADGKPPATILGDVSYHPNYAAFLNPGDHLATQAGDTADLTIMFVGRSVDTNDAVGTRPYFISNLNGPAVASPSRTSAGVSIVVNNTDTLSLVSARWNGSASSNGTITLSGNNFAQFNYIEAYCSNTQRYMRNRTQELIVDLPTNVNRDPATSAFRLAGNALGQTFGKSNIAFVAIYNRVLTQQERDAIYIAVRAIMAKRGYGV